MPVTTDLVILSQVDIFRVRRWWVDLNPDTVTIYIEAGKADGAGSVSVWLPRPDCILSGAPLLAAMDSAAKKIKRHLDAGVADGAAYYRGTKEALYEACQSAGAIPPGTLT